MIIDLLILLIVAVLVWWIIQQFPLPEPLNKIIMIVFVVVVAIALIQILLGGGLGLRGRLI